MTEKLYNIEQIHYEIDHMKTFTGIKHYTAAAPPELAGRYGCPQCGHTVAREDLHKTWRGLMCPACFARYQPNEAKE